MAVKKKVNQTHCIPTVHTHTVLYCILLGTVLPNYTQTINNKCTSYKNWGVNIMIIYFLLKLWQSRSYSLRW